MLRDKKSFSRSNLEYISMTSQQIEFEGKSVSYSVQGNGQAIILLHGFLESKEIWSGFAEELSDHFRVISIDLPGHGKSDLYNNSVHTMEFMADCVNAILDSLEIKSCVMAGHSMGGYVTLAFAEKYGDKLRGMALINSHAAADSDEAKQNRTRTINLIREDRIGFITSFVPDLYAIVNRDKLSKSIEKQKEVAYNTSKESIIAALEGMKSRNDSRLLLENTKIPVLIIAGKDDTRIPVGMITTQAELPAHCELILMAETGHMSFLEKPVITLKIFNSFCERMLQE